MAQTIFNFSISVNSSRFAIISANVKAKKEIASLYQFDVKPQQCDIEDRVKKIIAIIISEVYLHVNDSEDVYILVDCPPYFVETLKFELNLVGFKIAFPFSFKDGSKSIFLN